MFKTEKHSGWANSLKLHIHEGAMKIFKCKECEIITQNVKQKYYNLGFE